jgi:hypothetical protein
MSSPTGDTASSAPKKSERREVVFTLAMARRMLPLVGRIVADLVHGRRHLTELRPEQDRLDRQRRQLAWPQRSRRYQLRDEIALLEARQQEAMAELEGLLGVVLLDPVAGLVGFPTVVNDRPAFFSWRLGEAALEHWQFVGEAVRRAIPSAWAAEVKGAR